MPTVDEGVLADRQRLAAARRARQAIPALPMPLNAIARLAARSLAAPMAIVAIMEVEEEHFVGSYGLPAPLNTHQPVPVAYSLCKYIVSADHPVIVHDMTTDPNLAGHAFAVEHGARAFAGVPLRDADDHTIGALLVVDTVLHAFTDADVTRLVEISALLAEPAADVERLDAAEGEWPDGTWLLDGVQEAFIVVGSTGVVEGWNPAATRLLGWAAAEVQGCMIDELILPETQRDRFHEALPGLIAASARGTGRSMWMVVRHRDGRELPVQATLSTLDGRHGPLVCGLLIAVTDQQKADREAGVERGFLGALLDSLDTGVIAVDQTGRPIVCNQALRTTLGIATSWTPEQLDGMYAERVRRPGGGPLPLEKSPLARALRGEFIRDLEVLIRVPGERDNLYSGNAQPVIGADGQRLGAVLALHEVTERRRVERFRDCQLAVATAVAHSRSLEKAAPEVTRAIAAALGWLYVELRLVDEISETLQLAGHYCARPGVRNAYAGRTIIKGHGLVGSVWATAEPLSVPDLRDTRRLVRTALSDVNICLRSGVRTVIALPIVDGDLVVGVLTCCDDAPERDQKEIITLLGGITEQLGQFMAQLRAEQLSREVGRSRGDFMTLVGHELRTPLTSISSAIELLLEETTAAEGLRRLMRGIARNTASLCTIVDELLDLTGLEAGYQPIVKRPIDLAEITRQALHEAREMASTNHVTVEARIVAELVTVGDPLRLRQVVDNLLSNAVKYSHTGDLVRLTLDHDDHSVTIAVTDTGIGIPPDERDHLFERFYRASNVRHHGIPGTGLGLPLVHAIVEAHHGSVTFTEPAAGGTTVTVRLPFTAAGPASV